MTVLRQHYNNITIRSLLLLRTPPAHRASQTSPLFRNQTAIATESVGSARDAATEPQLEGRRLAHDKGHRTGLRFELGIETQTDLLNPTEGNVFTTLDRWESVDRHSRVRITRTGSYKDQNRDRTYPKSTHVLPQSVHAQPNVTTVQQNSPIDHRAASSLKGSGYRRRADDSLASDS